jgi:hypothetical protein
MAKHPYISAFPDEDYRGMSLRDWFAGQYVAGRGAVILVERDTEDTTPTAVARVAYEIADAMLAMREKE